MNFGTEKVGFMHKLGLYLLIFAAVIILINCGVLYYQTKDYKSPLDYLGSKVIYSTDSLNKDSLELINIDKNLDNFELFIKYLMIFLNLYLDLTAIFIWVKLSIWIIKLLLIHDNSLIIVSTIMGFILFFSLQMLVLLLKGYSILIPFTSFYNFILALISLSGGKVKEFADKILPSYNYINKTI